MRVSLCLIREEVKIKNRQRATELLLVEGLFWEGGFGEGDPGFFFCSSNPLEPSDNPAL